MDKAYANCCRADYTRATVFKPLFDELKTQYEKTATPCVIVVDGASMTVDGAPIRVQVFTDTWENIRKQMEKTS